MLRTFFHRVLPLALPALVLVAVLSSCGKGEKIITSLKRADNPVKAILGQRANGEAQGPELDPDMFRQKCASEKNGIVDMKNGNLCVVLESTAKVDSSTIIGTTPVGAAHKGDLVVATGSLDVSQTYVEVAGERLLNFGERKLSVHDGQVAVVNVGPLSGSGNVTIWACYDHSHLNPVYCNENLFKP